MEFDTDRFQIIDHPLVQHKLHILRDKDTSTKDFRELVTELAVFEGYEALRDLPLEDVEVETPLETTTCRRIAGKKLAIIPILRAGLGMVDGILTLVPSARVGHVGMYRDPETHEPIQYYCKFPPSIAERTCLIVDPMLATGGSLTAAIQFLRERASRTSAASRWSRPPRASRPFSTTTPTCVSIPARSTASSMTTPTSSRAWAMPATASTAPSKTDVPARPGRTRLTTPPPRVSRQLFPRRRRGCLRQRRQRVPPPRRQPRRRAPSSPCPLGACS